MKTYKNKDDAFKAAIELIKKHDYRSEIIHDEESVTVILKFREHHSDDKEHDFNFFNLKKGDACFCWDDRGECVDECGRCELCEKQIDEDFGTLLFSDGADYFYETIDDLKKQSEGMRYDNFMPTGFNYDVEVGK